MIDQSIRYTNRDTASSEEESTTDHGELQHFPLYSECYVELIEGFSQHLHDEGFSTQAYSDITRCIHDLLQWLEYNGKVSTEDIYSKNVLEYSQYLSSLPLNENERLIHEERQIGIQVIQLFFTWLSSVSEID